EQLARRGRSAPAKAPQITEDDLYARLLKYIPAPLIGLYLMASNAIVGSAKGNVEKGLAWGAFVVFVVAVAMFLRGRGVKRRRQIVVSLAAFAAWAAASPGPFQLIGGWE